MDRELLIALQQIQDAVLETDKAIAMATYPSHFPFSHPAPRVIHNEDLRAAIQRLLAADLTVEQLRTENEVLRAELAAQRGKNDMKTRITNRIAKAKKLMAKLTEANDYTAMAVVSARMRELESLL